jgi:hypothetical protein
VVDPHQHCPCNGVFLCSTCHQWVHSHPFDARGLGLIVSRHVESPSTVPVVGHYGTLILRCSGEAFVSEGQTG